MGTNASSLRPGLALRDSEIDAAASAYLKGRLRIFYLVLAGGAIGLYVLSPAIQLIAGTWSIEGALDPASVVRIEDIVLQVHERGTKVVFVTHDVGQARRLADDVLFLNRGRVTEHTDAARFFDQPASREARAYLDGQIVL